MTSLENIFLLFTLQTALFLHGLSALEDFPGVKMCEGVPKSNVGGSMSAVKWLKDYYENCTHILHHLVISKLKDGDDITFLKSIVEVAGSLIIERNTKAEISLPNLKVVRGQRLHMYNPRGKQSAAVYIGDNEASSTGILDLRSLRSVVNGNIVVEYNKNFCFANKVSWSALTERTSDIIVRKNSCKANVRCTGCSFCWGPKKVMCQTVHHKCTYFNHTCSTNRCLENGNCCHEQCVGGCTGNLKTDCVSCANVILGNSCLESCPPKTTVDRLEVRKNNKNFRYTFGSFCVKHCPDNFFINKNNCVRRCPEDSYAGEDRTCRDCSMNDCLRQHCRIENLKRALRREKKWIDPGYTDRLLLRKIRNCRILDAYEILINEKAVSSSEMNHVRVQDLENLRNLEVISGCLHLDLSAFHKLVSLTFLSKLKSITCPVSDNGLIIVNSNSLQFLDLTSLKSLNVETVNFAENTELCYMDKFKFHFSSPYSKHIILRNLPNHTTCRQKRRVCDEQCVVARGCWGPGYRRCVACKNKNAGGGCVRRCEEEPGFFTSTKPNKKCQKCHKECLNCTGAEAHQCVGECRHLKNGKTCVFTCPKEKYNARRVCLPCNAKCLHSATSRLSSISRFSTFCTGPGKMPGPGGCNFCSILEIDAKKNRRTCLTEIPDGYYCRTINSKERDFRVRNYTDERTQVCVRCNPSCRTCTGSRNNECSSCAKGYLFLPDRRCVKECPTDTFQVNGSNCLNCHDQCRECNGTSASDCIACRINKLYLGENGTKWQCVKTCPKNQPYSFSVPGSDEIRCSANDQNALKSSFSLAALGIIPLLLCAFCIVACITQRRRRYAFLKEREQLQLKYTRRLEEEMVQLNSSNVAPNFSQIRVIGGKQLQKFGKLGVGAFGTVYRGRWTPQRDEGVQFDVKINVAIKELRQTCTAMDSKKFLSEAHVMASVNHPYCVHLLGVCLSSPMLLISEFVPLGNLTSYVPRHRETLTGRVMLLWCLQIAKALAYLESRGIVHRDVAARNVLLQRDDLVRITDFGLAKLLDSGNELKSTVSELLPVAWSALESLTDLAFSHKSDVWAYGVTLWEIFTFCECQPYSRMGLEQLVDFLDSGERLEQPDSCTLDLYLLLLKCWVREPSGRPTFEEIVTEVKMMAADPERFVSTLTKGSEEERHLPVERFNSNEYLDPIRTQPSPSGEKETNIDTDDEEEVEGYLLPKAREDNCDGGYLAVRSSPK